MTRLDGLLKKIVAALKEGRTPLDSEFLVENKVTSDECVDLLDTMAMIIGGYVNLPRDLRLKTMLAYGLEGTGIPFALVDEQIDRDKLLKKLGDISPKAAKAIKDL